MSGVEDVAAELSKRSDWREVLTVALGDSSGLSFSATSQTFHAFPCASCLAITCVVPGWGFGWRKILDDEEVYQVLSWLLHYARQHINRSSIVAILMAVWEEHSRVLHPFGTEGMLQRYGPVLKPGSDQSILEAAKREALDKWGTKKALLEPNASTSAWLTSNMLDPFLHQAAFHFLRGQELVQKGFELEAVVAFDCVLESIVHLVQVRCRHAKRPSRSEVLNLLGISGAAADVADHANLLRNNFGAHAGGWRWWDYGELLEDHTVEDISNVVSDAFRRAAQFESTVRAIDPSPSRWDDWLFTNFKVIWDTVWFEKLTK
ncbi:hypothetical protein [Bradyrhizobium sp. RDI18]|uniref:hypothetical protein n=1 Tax=Bradyrhizobium sp. RDI18 TaxID=3367400 RepID=UPI003716541D